jgi:hypothetical protein
MKYKFLIPIAIILIISACMLYKSCGKDQPVFTPIPTKEVIRTVQANTAPLQAKLDSIQLSNRLLEATNKTLEQRFYASQQRLNEAIDNMALYQPPPDSSYTEELITAATVNNDACVEVIANLHAQVANRDTAMQVQAAQYDVLQDGFMQLAENDAVKEAAIKDLNKKLRGQKATGWIKTGAIVAAAVIIVKTLIK